MLHSEPNLNNPSRIPVTLIGGYLGAGKTTLVNHLLRQAQGRRLAVLVNDFGDINIDADLIESQTGDVINLAGGCMCCSFGSELMSTLGSIANMSPAPDHILIETSGVAQPASVARTLKLVASLQHDATIVIADCESARQKARDRYLGDTVLSQLREADLIILNKTDLVSAAALEELHHWCLSVQPRAAVIQCVRAELDPAVIFDWQAESNPNVSTRPDGFAKNAAHGLTRPARSLFESCSLEYAGRIDAALLAQSLVNPELQLYRAKALISDRDGQGFLIQIVGARSEVTPSNHPNPEHARLVCIGAQGKLNVPALQAALNHAMIVN